MIKNIIENQKLTKKQVSKIDFKIKEPKAIQMQYYKALKQLVNELKNDVRKTLIPVLKETKITTDSVTDILFVLNNLQQKYSNIFSFAYETSNKIVNSINRYNQSKFNSKAQSSLGVSIENVMNENNIGDILALQTNNQVNLIKSIPQEFFKELEIIITKGYSEGLRHEEIAKQIQGVKGISSVFGKLEKRAKLIARNEIGNINANLNKMRQQNIGVDFYEWNTSEDEVVRPSHKVMNNKICKWNDNSVYADSIEDARNNKWKKRSSIGGYVGVCGADYNCRCIATAIIPDFDY